VQHGGTALESGIAGWQQAGMPELLTTRLRMRPHVAADSPHVAALWGNPEVTRWIGGAPSTAQESWFRLLRYLGHWQALGFGYFAVLDRADGAFLGEVGLADFRRDITPSLDGMAEAGWVLAPAAWGRGIATEALSALLDWYAATPSPRPVACIIAPENQPSLRLAHRLGFRVAAETTYRDAPTLVLRRS
jgi:RimJ/RimL family protein N-acetyltransferase